jgi:glycine/D-amino acid oxidase-like deaminating enzyme
VTLPDTAGFTGSLWHATARPGPATPPLEADLEVETAVVGAGFTGLSAALHLAEAGRSVAVLEQAEAGFGASGRNAGFVVPNLARVEPDEVVARLGQEKGEALVGLIGGSADLVFELIRRHGIACEARQDGWIQAAHAPAALPRIEARVEQWGRRGRPVELLDRATARRLTGHPGFEAGWRDRSGGTLHPLDYARGLAAAALRLGARIHGGTPVLAIERGGPARFLLRTPRATVAAGTVLLCLNAHADPLRPDLARSFIPLTVYQIATEPLDAGTRARILPEGGGFSDTRFNLLTCRLERDGRAITGGMAVLPHGADRRLPEKIHARLLRELGLRAPLAFAWRGVAAITPDLMPRLYRPEPGLFAAIGCNGRGIAITTALGRVLAEAATGADPDGLPVPLHPLRPLPLHALARHAPRLALLQGLVRDWRSSR